jgi:hypothetical protein
VRTFLTASALLIGSWVLTQQMPERPSMILQQRLQLSRSEAGALERGQSFAKTLRAGDRREIAAGGAIRVDVPLEFFLQRFADIVSFKQSPIVRQIGKFSDPPRRTDLDSLTFEAADLDSLKACRAGDCDIQLSVEQIQRIQTGIDWSRTDARMQANRVLRGMLFEYVERYRSSDGQGLLVYANERTPLRVSDELRLLAAHSSEMVAGLPGFVDSLLNGKPLEGTEEFIYWSKEQFGLKPVVSITHVIIYSPRRTDVPDVMIASKQIYASRYLAASLAITLGVAPSPGPSSSFYMVYANRTRPRAFPPLIGGLVRRIAQGQTREGLEEQLTLAKTRLESAYRPPALQQ